jgi:hypothetical protein
MFELYGVKREGYKMDHYLCDYWCNCYNLSAILEYESPKMSLTL